VVALIALGAFSAFSILHTVIKHPRTTVVIMTWPFAAVCEIIHDKDICPLVTPNSFVEFTKSKLGLPHDAQIFPPD
jgi:hypothetical protein